METEPERHTPLYARIYAVVRQIPPGKVATYGQIASLVSGCTARRVGYALAALSPANDVPWQRVINRLGKVSPHGDGIGSLLQRQLLLEEGVVFDDQGRIDLERFGWQPAGDGPAGMPDDLRLGYNL